MTVLLSILTIALKENKPHTRFWYLSHQYAAKAKASLRIHADLKGPYCSYAQSMNVDEDADQRLDL